MSDVSYSENPRTCTACGQDLFPNYMEGRWEHHAKGCKFTGHVAASVPEGTGLVPGWGPDSPEMIGKFRNEVKA